MTYEFKETYYRSTFKNNMSVRKSFLNFDFISGPLMIEIFQTILEFAPEADPVQPDPFIKDIWPFSIKNPNGKRSHMCTILG